MKTNHDMVIKKEFGMYLCLLTVNGFTISWTNQEIVSFKNSVGGGGGEGYKYFR